MTRQEIEERMDALARKVELAHKYYVETRDDEKLVEELYELVRELETLKKELIGREAQALRVVKPVDMPSSVTREEIEQRTDELPKSMPRLTTGKS
jgi:hypothetical protein